MKNQPKIEVKPNTLDKQLITSGWLVLILNMAFIAFWYSELPEKIPMHFNLQGEVDSYGSRSSIWVLWLIGVVTYFGMSLVATKVKPHLMNYPVEVTSINATKLYAMSIRLIVVLNLSMAILFALISLTIVSIALNKLETDLSWLLYSIIAITLLLPCYFIYKMLKESKS